MILLPFDYPNTCGECEIRGYGTFCNVVLDDIDVNTKHKDCPIQDGEEVTTKDLPLSQPMKK